MGLPVIIPPIFPSSTVHPPAAHPTQPTFVTTASMTSSWMPPSWISLPVPTRSLHAALQASGAVLLHFVPQTFSSSWLPPTLDNRPIIRARSLANLRMATFWVPAIGGPVVSTSNVTDLDVLRMVSDRLLEPELPSPAPSTTMWTLDDWVKAADQAQKDFVRDSGIIVKQAGYTGDADNALNVTPQVEYLALPQDLIDILRVAWMGYDSTGSLSSIDELPREDAWSLDHGDSTWEVDLGSPKPTAYNEGLPRVPSLYFSHAPADVGKVDLLYVGLTTTLTGAGVPLEVPDEAVPYIVWGTLAILLEKAGEAGDPGRAQYCRQRYQEGISLFRMLLSLPFAVRGRS